MLSPHKSIDGKSNIFQRVMLGIVLTLLLWSRILSSYSAIQQVHASFSTDIHRGDIELPETQDQAQMSLHHVNTQADLTNMPRKRLEVIERREKKAQRIRNFYSRWNAPMAEQAYYIVEISEHFGIDYRLIPAISIVESSGGKYCFKPYNPFGWGKSGFNSFEDAIYTVARGLSQGYGTDDPYIIGPTYNPVTPDAWSSKVDRLMKQI